MAKDEKQYSIRLKNGKYIGLVNFGKTYIPCENFCILRNISEDNAKKIAKDWDGQLFEVKFKPCLKINKGEGWEISDFFTCNNVEVENRKRELKKEYPNARFRRTYANQEIPIELD